MDNVKIMFLKLLGRDPNKVWIRDRMRFLPNCLNKKSSNFSVLTSDEKKRIDAIWNPFKKYFDYRYFEFFKTFDEKELEYYIPCDFWSLYIDCMFTYPGKASVVDDKNMYDLYFHDIKRPKTILRKINGFFMDADYELISKEDAFKLCGESQEVIIKKSCDSCGGQGITFWITSFLYRILKMQLMVKIS